MGAPIVIPAHRIFRTFVQAHPEFIFIYGQDYTNKGCLGQAWQMANEPNSFPVCTLLKVCNSQSDKYLYDDQFESNAEKICERIQFIPRDNRPIIYAQRLGRGHSQLYQRAPRTYAFLIKALKEIQYTNIVWDWNQSQS